MNQLGGGDPASRYSTGHDDVEAATWDCESTLGHQAPDRLLERLFGDVQRLHRLSAGQDVPATRLIRVHHFRERPLGAVPVRMHDGTSCGPFRVQDRKVSTPARPSSCNGYA